MSLAADLSTLHSRLSQIEDDVADAVADLASAHTAEWVSTAADAYRSRLTTAQQALAGVDPTIVLARSALTNIDL
ncbi:hypothetical protein [Sanguibacter suaedae]|uniref:Uncharacterized protein n=1 Tax=Sanguibacter suaedae TaxID=2795737 RepID=A0A934MAF4_9MICO|nr:hypothetical protein [Sanguibacter suaedae]MBI9115708.1 hypothetical protein [Sanguibacter suaedae]